MTIPRKLLVDRTVTGFYHCISRCVRRAFLCGAGFDHRKDWIRDRLQQLAEVFAIDIAAYAVMSSHLHVVVKTDPDLAARWSEFEVVTRWSRLFPASIRMWATMSSGRDMLDESTMDQAIRIVAKDADRVATLRDRLSDLSWFMKCTKEPIARRANREDGCTGCFWEGRFKSPRLLDDAAILTGMVYVDLNPMRAGLATTPEHSDHTSVQDRIHVRQLFEKQNQRRRRASKRAARLVRRSANLRSAEHGIWLAPIARDGDQPRSGVLPLTLDEYLAIVDATGRMVRSRKHGFIPSHLPPILERLNVDVSAWAKTWGEVSRIFGTALGNRAARAAEAARRGRTRVIGSVGSPMTAT